MNKLIIALVVLTVVGIGTYYLVFNNNPTATPAYTPATVIPDASKTSAAANNTVSIKNFSFNPSTVTIKTGTKVTWVNNDTISHTVTSDSGNLLNSLTLSPGQSFNFIFTAPGPVSYHCAVHPMMKGTIVVEN